MKEELEVTKRRYSIMKSRDVFFLDFDITELKCMSDKQRDKAYNKYKCKYIVHNRDNFECQNSDCLKTNDKIDMHHIKAKRNNGADKPRNCVTLCLTCHNAYERGKRPITFLADAVHLPPHLRNQTFIFDPGLKVIQTSTFKERRKLNMKNRTEGKVIRRNNRDSWGKIISWELICILMSFLEKDYTVRTS